MPEAGYPVELIPKIVNNVLGFAVAETPRGFNQPACDGMAALREVASISWRKFELDLQQDIVAFIFAPKPGLDDAS